MNLEQTPVVFVLGAGASSDAGLPLYNELLDPAYFERLLPALEELGRQHGGVIAQLCVQWREYVEGYLAAECARFQRTGMDFETLLTSYDSPTRRGERSALLAYYRQTLAFAENLAGHSAQRLLYLRCFARWLHGLVAAGCSVGLLSFNHDLLIERTISELGIPFHYGLEPSTHGFFDLTPGGELVISDAYPVRAQLGKGVGLYKLHGSSNWTICENGHLIYYADEVFLTSRAPGGNCARCSQAAEPCIIPPQRTKNCRVLTPIWEHAGTALERAEALVFVGYSLPSYDVDSLRLFQTRVSQRANILVFARSISAEMRTRFESVPHAWIEFVPVPFGAWIIAQQRAG